LRSLMMKFIEMLLERTILLSRWLLAPLYLALIALIPTVVQRMFNFPAELSYLLGGTSLLILVGVDLDVMSQVEAQLKMHHSEGLVRKGHIRSRNL